MPTVSMSMRLGGVVCGTLGPAPGLRVPNAGSEIGELISRDYAPGSQLYTLLFTTSCVKRNLFSGGRRFFGWGYWLLRPFSNWNVLAPPPGTEVTIAHNNAVFLESTCSIPWYSLRGNSLHLRAGGVHILAADKQLDFNQVQASV